ncbi:collagen alpha-5(IV) chain-like [Sciurus carolinensis]|uniref:collagen alpha-5(IV) chain-like n=1 Tax=Sciurus carolinensis TaxID=30640 RepID=UPI001FB20E22|nr:collagen alpha-5(IV) chain-like [Sciurus carolinensis]
MTPNQIWPLLLPASPWLVGSLPGDRDLETRVQSLGHCQAHKNGEKPGLHALPLLPRQAPCRTARGGPLLRRPGRTAHPHTPLPGSSSRTGGGRGGEASPGSRGSGQVADGGGSHGQKCLRQERRPGSQRRPAIEGTRAEPQLGKPGARRRAAEGAPRGQAERGGVPGLPRRRGRAGPLDPAAQTPPGPRGPHGRQRRQLSRPTPDFRFPSPPLREVPSEGGGSAPARDPAAAPDPGRTPHPAHPEPDSRCLTQRSPSARNSAPARPPPPPPTARPAQPRARLMD